MSASTLRFIRFFAPAVILVVLTYALAKVIGISSAKVPVSVNDLGYNLSYIIIAAIYQYLPLRRIAYAPFREDVDERIRIRLVLISGLQDEPTKFAWKRVANVFYSLVDNDKSLEKRSEDVMFNGAMMTSFADLTAISALFAIGCLVAYFVGATTLRPFVLLAMLFLVSIIMQFVAMRRHQTLGEYQLGYIEQQLSDKVIEKMTKLYA